MNRWKSIALVVSLVLNLIFIGFIAGHFLRVMRHPPMGPFAFGMARMIETLPPERRNALRPLVRQSFMALRPRLNAMRDMQTAVERALAAEPFDAAELTRQLNAMRANLDAAQVSSLAALVRISSQLTHTERLKLAEALRDPPWMMHGKRGMRLTPPDAPRDAPPDLSTSDAPPAADQRLEAH